MVFVKGVCLTGPKPKGIKVETFRIGYLIRTPKVEKLSLQPISCGIFTGVGPIQRFGALGCMELFPKP